MSFDLIATKLVRSLDELTLRDGVFCTASDEPTTRDSWAMRFMHATAVARIYEAAWRPALIRMVSPLTYATEDVIVDRHLRPRAGLRLLDLCCGTARTSRLLGVDIDQSLHSDQGEHAPARMLVETCLLTRSSRTAFAGYHPRTALERATSGLRHQTKHQMYPHALQPIGAPTCCSKKACCSQ